MELDAHGNAEPQLGRMLVTISKVELGHSVPSEQRTFPLDFLLESRFPDLM